MRHWDKIVFASGLSVFVFLAGMAVAKFELFPYEPIARLWKVARAYYVELLPHEMTLHRVNYERSGVIPAVAGDGGDIARLVTVYEPTGMRAVLVDGAGSELHDWQTTFSAVYGPKAPHIERQAGDDRIHWHGGHVSAEGDFTFNFEGGNFPYGGGLVRLDARSRVKWKIERNTHHNFAVLDDGGVVTPSQEYRWDGIPACRGQLEPPYYEDQVLLVSANGEVEDTISVLAALCDSTFRSLLMMRGNPGTKVGDIGDDPLHLNDAEPVTPELAPRFPMADVGDILVSLRNLNALAIVDRETRKVRWQLAGPFIRQHDADLLPNGNIMVFDNMGGDPDRGRTRILELDPATQAIVWAFEGTPEAPFNSSRAGNQTLLPNGNLLIAESRGGRALEVTREPTPRIVWQYVSLRGRDEGGGMPNALMRVDGIDRARLPFLDRVEVAEDAPPRR